MRTSMELILQKYFLQLTNNYQCSIYYGLLSVPYAGRSLRFSTVSFSVFFYPFWELCSVTIIMYDTKNERSWLQLLSRTLKFPYGTGSDNAFALENVRKLVHQPLVEVFGLQFNENLLKVKQIRCTFRKSGYWNR